MCVSERRTHVVASLRDAMELESPTTQFFFAASLAVTMPSSFKSYRLNSATVLFDHDRLYSLIDTCPSPLASFDLNQPGRFAGSRSPAPRKRKVCRLSLSFASAAVPPAVP